MSGTGRFFRGKARNKEAYFVAFSLLYLAVGVGAVWFIRSTVGVRGDATLVAFLIVPLALYLTLSGRVSEITAGGLAVKLRQAGHERAAQAWTEALADTDHGLTFDLQHYWPVKTDPNRPQVATLTLGGALEVTEAGAGGPTDVKTVRRRYERDAVLASLRSAAAEHPVPVVLLLGELGSVVAYLTYRSAVDLLENENRGDQFIELVNAGDPGSFDGPGGFSGVRTKLPSDKVTNVEALETMEKIGIDVLVVVNRKGEFGGIIERERVLSRMMLALASSPSAE